ncbi:mmr1/hsr1 GTP binding protein, putative [Entamoeba invadens IP1]|uniref:mmr1/hsr1 GTP binding protein, putative n=1 Tax=Entamoeba invadens IP1 TaxID=370355 RepID=UPI0002C3DCFC|nr:mmr1/hsr1 GTP binding protein, putative [Entamoeba invadens IP1]ELP93520.1 mmr1/hsr1 GTP binding protein, putative [Entamoeba invadens IP1]|eukprot:XP_004260291.1 mmr1/hsr1 GTP binding protein, putative [Entamoeba invadens IP1]
MEGHKKRTGGKPKSHQRDKKHEKIEKQANPDHTQSTVSAIDEAKTKVAEQLSAQKRDLRPKMLGMETKEEIEKRKELAALPIDLTKRESKQRAIPFFESIGEELEIITRPPWNYSMSKDQLDQNEKTQFSEWIERLLDCNEKLNYFESNLETWRQLWRVVERSEVVLIIVDCRFGCLQFNTKIADWIKKSGKGLGVILNKVDLVDTVIVKKWQTYFEEKFSVKTLPVRTNRAIAGQVEDFEVADLRKEKTKTRKRVEGDNTEALEQFEDFVFSLQPTPEKIDKREPDDAATKNDSEDEEEKILKTEKGNRLGVGLIGNPNVGKSSLLNFLVGKKVSGVSSHPGRTKYLQTYRLGTNVLLVDCPGMMFPMKNQPLLIQVISGVYPLSQLREPYSIIRFFIERLPLEKNYGIELKEGMSVLQFVDEIAEKKKYFTGKAGRPDSHKAAREILSDCIMGRTVFMFDTPVDKTEEKL